jgi:uncharacterized RDD family membrane protein YckC
MLLDSLLLLFAALPLALVFPADAAEGLHLLVAIAYFVILHGGPRGQTVGKRALGIRVIDAGAPGPIGYGRAFVRYLVEIVSAVVILLGYLWMLWDREKQTWHDKAARSLVVPESAYPVRP